MKFFALFVVMMMVAVQAFALPAVPAPPQSQAQAELEPEPIGNLPSGAPKAKRALYYNYYTPYVPTLRNYNYYTPTYYYYPYDVIV